MDSLRRRMLTVSQYWVVFSLFTVLESFINIVYWFPFYFVFKFVFLLWLSLPVFRYVSSPITADAEQLLIGPVAPKSSSSPSWLPLLADTSSSPARPRRACAPRLAASTSPSKPRALPQSRYAVLTACVLHYQLPLRCW